MMTKTDQFYDEAEEKIERRERERGQQRQTEKFDWYIVFFFNPFKILISML